MKVNVMKKYYILRFQDRTYSDLFELDLKNKVIGSVSNRRLNKHKRNYDESIPLLEQIVRASCGEGICNYDAEKEYYEIVKYGLQPGEYYPRIYRPILNEGFSIDRRKCKNCSEEDNSRIQYYHEYMRQVNEYKNEFIRLKERFYKISNYIFFDIKNQACYSSEVRAEILMLNTEIESQMKGVLIANASKKKMYRTKDYFQLFKMLKLGDYEIELKDFPKMNRISPYQNWNSEKPTKSLEWMDAYNLIKHDKYSNIEFATLKNLVDAFSALTILLYSQFKNFIAIKKQFDEVVKILKEPEWDDTDKYFFDTIWTAKPYF
jgi:hypothetical protein